MAKRTIGAALAAMCMAGCAADESDPVPVDGTLAPPPEGQGVQLTLGRSLEAGTEQVFCRRFVMPDGALDVARLEHQAKPGIHHVIIYREPDLTAADVDDELFECGDIPGQLLYTSQFAAEVFDYPAGVGIKLGAGEVLRVELHYVNTTAADIDTGVALNLWRSGAAITSEAASLFFYDRDIAIPPHSSWQAKMRCTIPEDIDILFGLPHIHRRGVGFRAYKVVGEQREQFIDSSGYGDLESIRFADPVHVAADQVVELECDYKNDSDDWYYQGPSGPNDEMCLLLGSYYPRMDRAGELCTVDDWGPIHEGAKTCGEALDCLNAAAATDPYAPPRCFTDTCPGSSSAVNSLGNCIFNNCQVCVVDAGNCQSCILSSCAAEVGVCAQATCAE
jgi:hypothetical protein